MPAQTARSHREKAVRLFLLDICQEDGENVAWMMGLCVGRVLLKRPEDGLPVEYDDTAKARHIRDWIVGAIAADAPWIHRLDSEGRPKKLMKFSTIDDIVREADKAMRIEAAKNGAVALVSGDEAVEMELADGFRIVKLLTPQALDRESGEMQHCVGNGGYDGLLAKEGYGIYSLRDAAGKAHVTVEIRDFAALQIQGKQNKAPLARYMNMIVPFLKRDEIVLAKHCLDGEFVMADGDRFVETSDLREVEEIRGNLAVNGKSMLFPEKLVVRGDLILVKCEFPNGLPREIEVDGDIRILDCRKFDLPMRAKAGGHLSIRSCVVEGHMESCEAGTYVSFDHSTLERLPEHLAFYGDLNLSHTDIKSLDGLREVRGSLVIESTDITDLPVGLSIRRHLNAKSSQLSRYPEHVTINGDVIVSNTPIQTLPRVKVNGALDISYTKVTDIPDGLEVTSLIAQGLTLDRLGPSVTIKQNLALRGTWVRLQPGLTVGGTLFLQSARIHRLPDDLSAGGLDATGAEMKSIGRNLRVSGDLDVSDTSIVTLPGDMKVGGHIMARGTYISTLPHGFETQGDLDLTNSEIAALPAAMHVGGSLVLHQTEVGELPDDLHVGGDLTITHTEIDEVPESVFVGGTVHADSIGERRNRMRGYSANWG